MTRDVLISCLAVTGLVLMAASSSALVTPCEQSGSSGSREYSNDLDWHDAEGGGTQEPGRTIIFEGDGQTENGQCIGCSSGISGVSTIEVDALANSRDEGFQGIVAGTGYLIVSLNSGSSTDPSVVTEPISLFYSGPTSAFAENGVWADHDINLNDDSAAGNLDGVNLYGGGDVGSHANKISFAGDDSGVSVYNYFEADDNATEYISRNEIFSVVSGLEGLGALSVTDIDVDALMVWDTQGSMASWNDGDEILFSLAPVPGKGFFGNAIVHYTKGVSVEFLTHGGVVWDTTLPVATLFGSGAMDIDALEMAFPSNGGACDCGPEPVLVVPEPCSASLLFVLGICLAGFSRRRA